MDRDRELDEVVHKLIGLTAINKDFSWGSFLLSSIHKCADDETLDKMIADIKEYVNKVEANPQLLG